MFKGLIKKIKKFQKQEILRRKCRLRTMYYEIRGAVINFYEDKQRKEGTVELPPFIRADKFMEEYVKADKDIEFYYKQCLKYNACARV